MRIFFLPIRLIDLLDIAIVAFVLYQLYKLMQGTIAVQVFFGLAGLYLVDQIVMAADMTMLRSLFGAVGDVFVLALIILFQPELRRLLTMIGRNPLVRRFMSSPEYDRMIEEICTAVEEMSEKRVGALIAFERSAGLRTYVETGTPMEAKVSHDLLTSVFYPKNPLHDGAVIIQGQRLAAARCILPVSHSMELSPHLGLRHRAGVGLTEQTDAFVVVVSEERGTISVAEGGTLDTDLDADELYERLVEALAPLRTSGEDEQFMVSETQSSSSS